MAICLDPFLVYWLRIIRPIPSILTHRTQCAPHHARLLLRNTLLAVDQCVHLCVGILEVNNCLKSPGFIIQSKPTQQSECCVLRQFVDSQQWKFDAARFCVEFQSDQCLPALLALKWVSRLPFQRHRLGLRARMEVLQIVYRLNLSNYTLKYFFKNSIIVSIEICP